MKLQTIELKHSLNTVGQMLSNDVLAERMASLAKKDWKAGRNAHNISASMPALASAMKRSGEEVKLDCDAMDRDPSVAYDPENPKIYDCAYRLQNEDSSSSCNLCPFYDDAAPMHIPSLDVLKKVKTDVDIEKRRLANLLGQAGRCLVQEGLASIDGYYCDATGSKYTGIRMEDIRFYIPASVTERRWVKKHGITYADLEDVLCFRPIAEEDLKRAKSVLYHYLSLM